MSAEHEFTDNPVESRYELRAGDELLGWVDYRPAGASTIVAHTEVREGHGGEGLGGELVTRAMDAIVAEGKTVMPTCPFAAAYIARHPDRVAQVDPSLRGQFGG